jgi:O104-antigen biosynthesis beta-1,3-galactosyltransferase
MKLSVLMSVYLKESPIFLRACLSSLAAQTRTPDEVVIVEDGPLNQELAATLESYKNQLPIVRIRLPLHAGLGAALRTGLNECQGEYVARMDSDDICVPRRFALQLDFLECSPQISIVGGAIAEFDEDPARPCSIRRLPRTSGQLRLFARSRNPLNHMTVMFRKASALSAGNYRPLLGFEDYDLWARMLMTDHHLHNLDQVLVYARCGNGMQGRRGGISYLKQEIDLYLGLYRMNFISAAQCAMNILLRAPVRLAPAPLRSMYYRVFLRERVAAEYASGLRNGLTRAAVSFAPERNTK